MEYSKTEIVQDVLDRYAFESHMECVVNLLSRSDRSQRRALRSHLDDPIVDRKEIAIRDHIDELLGLVSALEIYSIAMGGTPELSAEQAGRLLHALGASPIRKFYEEFYPVPLPILFRQRLEGRLPNRYLHELTSEAEHSDDRTPRAFLAFIDLDLRWQTNADLEIFLALLDDYAFDDVDLSDILEIVNDPEAMAKLDPTEDELLYSGVKGLDDFLEMCCALSSLLDQVEGRPLLQSAIWCHFAYWLGSYSESVRSIAIQLSRQVSSWTLPHDMQDANLIQENAVHILSVLNKLTEARRYADPLVNSSAPILNDWMRSSEI